MGEQNEKNEVVGMIRAMNRCWTAGWHEDAFREYIHRDAVAIVPSLPGRLEGRDAYVSGWRGFCETAVVREWHETGHDVRFYAGGQCAVVTYLFSIAFSTGGQDFVSQGRDMFFLVREDGRWLVAADQFSPEPALPPGSGS
jgi:ketosteroid isomerase-like protein